MSRRGGLSPNSAKAGDRTRWTRQTIIITVANTRPITEPEAVRQLRLTSAWLVEAAKRCLGPVLKRSTPADHVGFTRLGAAELRVPRRAAPACPFPEQDERSAGGPEDGGDAVGSGSSFGRAAPARLRCCRAAEPTARSVPRRRAHTALGEMTRGIAHDFRNVLCMLSSGLNIAEANEDDPAKLSLALAAMEEGVLRGRR